MTIIDELAAQAEALRVATDAYIGSLHPNLVDIDVVQLVSVAVVSWLGAHAVSRGDLRRR